MQFRITHQTTYNNRLPLLFPLVNGFHQVTQFRLALGTSTGAIALVGTLLYFKGDLVSLRYSLAKFLQCSTDSFSCFHV